MPAAAPRALELFLCRWPTGATIPVSLPVDASADERASLRLALAAWEGAGLGVRFREVAPPEAERGIRLRFVAETERAEGKTALAGADCRLDGSGEIERARIRLDRANLDLLGRPVALSPAELTGAAVHELGHALGFQGHVAHGRSVMVRDVERVRRVGAAVMAGEPLDAPSVRALYAVPPGEVVGSLRLPEEAAAWLLLAHAHAHATRDDGPAPWARVGDTAALMGWPVDGGETVALRIGDWPDVVRGRAPLVLQPNVAARVRLQEPRATRRPDRAGEPGP